jgi:hypothetical protein
VTDQLVKRTTDRSTRPTTYRVVGPGCATGMDHCPNPDPVTVQRTGWTLTECIDASRLEPC